VECADDGVVKKRNGEMGWEQVRNGADGWQARRVSLLARARRGADH
jgi:hypothetical protein